ncbi:MAG: hypothetical protein LBP59_12985 [Planctomycetaceae bacterium]|nr:hypothetical protein [Planctomycetaceae bacterium]
MKFIEYKNVKAFRPKVNLAPVNANSSTDNLKIRVRLVLHFSVGYFGVGFIYLCCDCG